MSAIAQAAATVTATPLPSPQIIKETFVNTVPSQMPAVVIQGVQLLAMFLAAFLLSIIHRVAEWFTAKEKGWSPQLNAGLATAYSLGVGIVGTSTMGQIGHESQQIVALAISSFTAFSGSFWTYALRKAVTALSTQGVKAPTTTESLAPAVGQDPAQGVG